MAKHRKVGRTYCYRLMVPNKGKQIVAYKKTSKNDYIMDIMLGTHYVYDGDNSKEGLDPIVERTYHIQLIC